MAVGKDRAFANDLRTLFNVGAIRDLTDGQLLERFATDRSEAAELAFAVLAERHGPMVLRVCRSILADPHDTQDAFQATFLVLVKKARKLWVRDSLGPWLHQVAYRTASCARSAAARRRRLERRAAVSTIEAPAEVDDLARVLHEEIERLPERNRAPVVLCDLEGCSQEQAARHLGWPVGSVKSRLSRGRERLRSRLLKRGFAPAVVPSAATPRPADFEAAIPPALLESTIKAAVTSTTFPTLIKGAAMSLAQGVLFSMSITYWFKVASVLVLAGATVAGMEVLAQKPTPGEGAGAVGGPQAGKVAVSKVERGKLRGVAAERGRLEASHATDIHNKIKDVTQILSILPDGANVKKGDLVGELDSTALKDRRINQAITVESALAVFQNAKLAHEVAQIAVTEYLEGMYKQEFGALSGAVVEAQAAMKRAGNRLARTKQARQRLAQAVNGRGTTPAEIVAELDLDDRVEDAESAVLSTQIALEQAQTRLMVLQKYTKDKVLKELHSEVEKTRSAVLQKQDIWELEKNKLRKLDEQIESCKLHALEDGVLVLANDPYRGAGASPNIAVGAVVRERQKLFSIVDLNSPLQVIAQVPESMINRVRPGLKARIKVDALPNETYTGVVEAVPTVPDPSARTRPEKVYSTTIKLNEARPVLRPGFTASVEILVDELENVLIVPLGAVVRGNGRSQVAVKNPDGKFDVREVTLGVSNDTHVEVVDGIESGETVALDPAAAVK